MIAFYLIPTTLMYGLLTDRSQKVKGLLAISGAHAHCKTSGALDRAGSGDDRRESELSGMPLGGNRRSGTTRTSYSCCPLRR